MNTKLIIIFSAVLCILIAFSMLPRQDSHSLPKTVQKQEASTEIFFENYNKLPSKISPNKEASFSFTIHNLENKDKEYAYEVYADLGSTKESINKSSVFVRNQQSVTLQQSFSISGEFSRVKIVVNILEENQQIAFWITKEQM